jgi:hypothetical protein
MNAAIDQPPRHDAEALRIEIPKINYIDGHGPNLTRLRGRYGRRITHCSFGVNATFQAYIMAW